MILIIKCRFFFSKLGDVGSFFGLIIEFENLGMMKLLVLNDLVERFVGLGYGARLDQINRAEIFHIGT